MPVDEVQVQVLDQINKIIWMAAPWRWTLGTVTALTVVSATQDYTQAPPGDFLYIYDAYISDGASTPRHLEIVASLPTDVKVVGIPQAIAYVGSNTFRTFPKSGTIPGSPTQQIIMLYKKQAPTLTESNLDTAGVLVMDDEWFWVFVSGVLWLCYLYGDDSRAGSANIDARGQVQYTGQRAIFEAGIQAMREREKLPTDAITKAVPDPKMSK